MRNETAKQAQRADHALPGMTSTNNNIVDDFRVELKTVRSAPYTCLDENRRETASGGVFPMGQSVCAQSPLADLKKYTRVNAFAEQVGFISIDPKVLQDAD